MMDFYVINLVVLVLFNAGLSGLNYFRQKCNYKAVPSEEPSNGHVEANGEYPYPVAASQSAFLHFRFRFLIVYTLAVAADWLQGSFIYTLYRHNHGLSEAEVAALFTTGFVCGAISATFTGTLADKFGRKTACLAYCMIYSYSCVTVLFEDRYVLFLGRALGGVSTTLLFSVFETWMISEYRRIGYDTAGSSLSSLFSTMSTLNGIVAIVSGVMSQGLVTMTGSEKAPFMASIVCLFLAAQFILRYWPENYGESKITGSIHTLAPLKNIFNIAVELSLGFDELTLSDTDIQVMTLGLALCFFEGAMYVWVYFWSPAITSARSAAGIPEAAPFGLIFANFMCALMLGSWLFGWATKSANSVQTSSDCLQMALAVAAFSLVASILSGREEYRFWSFCIFEFCVGLYYPSIGYLKGNLVGEAQRGRVYGLMRLPLNVFVIIILSTVQEGDVDRDNRFIACTALLLLSVGVVYKFVPRKQQKGLAMTEMMDRPQQ